MSEPRGDDDELRAMLEARAHRVGASAPREVMAAVRDEMRAPREPATFAVVPLLTGRRRSGGLGWVVAALVAVVVLAVAGRGTFTSPSTATDAATAGASAMVSTAATTPPAATDVSLAGLRQALADRSLDGRILLVDTTLRNVAHVDCPAIGPCPSAWSLDLVGPVVTHAQPGKPIVPAVPGGPFPALPGTWVVVPKEGSLFLAGRVQDPVLQPTTWSAIASRRGPLNLGLGVTLEPIAGWMVPGGTGAARVIAERRPSSEGTVTGPSAAFTLLSPALGIGPTAATVDGPFLVRLGDGPLGDVVARYDPATLVRVAIPPVRCASAPSQPSMSCHDSADAALRVDQGSSPVTSIDFAYITPSSGHVVIRHEAASQDLVVDVRSNVDGSVVVEGSGPLARTEPAVPSPTASSPVPGVGSVPLDAVGLRTALASGSLDGAVVLVDGTLAERLVACGSPDTLGHPCSELYLPALDGVKVWEGRGPGAASPSALPPGSLVFVAGGGGLTFLGSWATPSANPITVAALLARVTPPAYDALAFVSGWLVVGGVNTCHPLAPGATPCPQNPLWLTGDEPLQDGLRVSDHGVTVSLDPSGFVGTPPEIVTPGPFLLRHAFDAPCDHGTQPGGVTCAGTQTGWEVVAALDGHPIVRAILPGH